MAWLPLAGSGLIASQTLPAGVDWNGSLLEASAVAPTDFSLTLTAQSLLRFTFSSYSVTVEVGSPEQPAQMAANLASQANTNGTSAFTPSPFTLTGTDFTWTGARNNLSNPYTESFSLLIEYDDGVTPTPPPPTPIVGCDEIGPVTRINVSGYQRTRGHLSRLMRGERRCLVVNFNGAIALGRTIASVTWRTNDGHAVAMSDGRINGREAICTMRAQNSGNATIRCEATLDNGEVYGQLVMLHVQGSPWFSGEASSPAGVASLTATA